MRKILVVTSAYVRPSVRPSVRTDSGGGGGKSQGNPTGSGECHLFLAGNRAVLLGNRDGQGSKTADWLKILRKKRHRIATEHACCFFTLENFNMADGTGCSCFSTGTAILFHFQRTIEVTLDSFFNRKCCLNRSLTSVAFKKAILAAVHWRN